MEVYGKKFLRICYLVGRRYIYMAEILSDWKIIF